MREVVLSADRWVPLFLGGIGMLPVGRYEYGHFMKHGDMADLGKLALPALAA